MIDYLCDYQPIDVPPILDGLKEIYGLAADKY